MLIFLYVVIVIASILLILVVLVQKSKGGGLASGFSSSNNIMGVRKTTDVIEKMTWGLAITVIVLSLISGKIINSDNRERAMNIPDIAVPAGADTAPNVDPNLPAPSTEGAPQAE